MMYCPATGDVVFTFLLEMACILTCLSDTETTQILAKLQQDFKLQGEHQPSQEPSQGEARAVKRKFSSGGAVPVVSRLLANSRAQNDGMGQQAPRQWQETVKSVLADNGVEVGQAVGHILSVY